MYVCLSVCLFLSLSVSVSVSVSVFATGHPDPMRRRKTMDNYGICELCEISSRITLKSVRHRAPFREGCLCVLVDGSDDESKQFPVASWLGRQTWH